ncbi:MAG: type III-B CRISPR module-associated Cmr3 family protein [Saprospiraceae bacterium]
MSNTQKALVTFTPAEPYFFGGETTHGSPGEGAAYYARSNPYPQQTTLCGALRNALRLTGYDFGLSSFDPDDEKLNAFGQLLSLSPMFLERKQKEEKTYYLKQALDRHNNGAPFTLTEPGGKWLYFDGDTQQDAPDKDPVPAWKSALWSGYDPKNDLCDAWVSAAAAASPVDTDDIFSIFNRPGIPKSELHNPSPDGPGLFKQDLMRLEAGWSFALLAEFGPEVDLPRLNGMSLQLGGENSIFRLGVEKTDRRFNDFFPKDQLFYSDRVGGNPRLVLVSDAFLPDEAWNEVETAVTATADFRHIQTHSSLTRVGNLHNRKPGDKGFGNYSAKLAKSAKYTLLQRGSVLVAKNADLTTLCGYLDRQPWTIIGFNQYFIYP